jgi:hypothetical protein
MTIDYNNVSHKVEKVWLDESTGQVMGQILLLDTPKGKIAQSIARSGTPLHISSRAMGSVSEKGAVTLEELVTFDLVGTPGFEQASLTKVHESFDPAGNIISESYAYDVDDSGKVVENAEIYNVVEQRIIDSIDTRIQEALKKTKGISREDILEQVQEYVNTKAAPNIQQYLKEELSEKIRQVSMSEVMTKNDVVKLMDETFVNKYAPIIEKWVSTEYTPVLENWLNTEYASVVEKWAIHEFAPVIEKWMTNEFAPVIEKWTTNEFAPVIEKWTINEFAPVIEKWIGKEFAPVVEKWVLNEFAPVVEKWVTTEFAGEQAEVIEKWMTESFAPVVQKWIIDEYSTTLESWVNTKLEGAPVIENKHRRTASKSSVLENLDAMINAAKNKPAKKPVDESAEQRKQREINECFRTGPIWLQHIPESLKLTYLALNESAKAKIARQASVRMFNSPADIHRFWHTRDFSSLVESNLTVPKRSSVNESVDTKVNPYHANLINLTKSLRR